MGLILAAVVAGLPDVESHLNVISITNRNAAAEPVHSRSRRFLSGSLDLPHAASGTPKLHGVRR